jgi:Bardet-Biedl syndrome 5 protein
MLIARILTICDACVLRVCAGGYVLGFRVDPDERLEQLHKEVSSYLQLFSSNPLFGVDFTIEDENAAAAANANVAPRVEEDVDIVEDQEDVHAVAAYLVDGNEDQDRQLGDVASSDGLPVDSMLGLAVEPNPSGITLDALWRVV